MQSGWPADHVKVIGFVDSQSFMDVTMRVDICSHRTVERQAGEANITHHVQKCQKESISTKHNMQLSPEDFIFCGDLGVLALLTAK